MKYEGIKERATRPERFRSPDMLNRLVRALRRPLKQRSPGTLSRMRWRTGGRIKRANGGGTTTRQAEVAVHHREVGLDAGSRRSEYLAWH